MIDSLLNRLEDTYSSALQRMSHNFRHIVKIPKSNKMKEFFLFCAEQPDEQNDLFKISFNCTLYFIPSLLSLARTWFFGSFLPGTSTV